VGKPSRSDPLTGNVPWRGGAHTGGWRRNGRKAKGVNQGDLLARSRTAGGWRKAEHWRDGASRSQSVHSSQEGP
jgi:hypothetical protein